MPNPLVGLTAASVGGSIFGAKEAGKASDKAVGASGEALDESKRQFDLVRDDTAVARETGNDALMTLGFLLGVRQPPSAESMAGLEKELADAKGMRDMSLNAQASASGPTLSNSGGIAAKPADIGAIDKNIASIQAKLDSAKKMRGISEKYPGGIGDFIKSQPGYQFGLDEGNRSLTNTLASRGQGQGGKAIKAAERFGIDYAGSKTDEHLNRLFTLAGYGSAGVNTSANAGQNLANATGNHAGVVGNAAFGQAGANITGVNNAINTGLSLYAYNQMSKPPPPPSSTFPVPHERNH